VPAGSKAEFASRISIGREEADESAHWLDMLAERGIDANHDEGETAYRKRTNWQQFFRFVPHSKRNLQDGAQAPR